MDQQPVPLASPLPGGTEAATPPTAEGQVLQTTAVTGAPAVPLGGNAGTPTTSAPSAGGRTGWLRPALLAVGVLVVLGGLAYGAFRLLSARSSKTGTSGATSESSTVPTTSVDLSGLKVANADISGHQVSVNGLLNVNDQVVLKPSARPTNPAIGQVYLDQTTNSLFIYNGTTFVELTNTPSSIASQLQSGNGISIAGATVANSGVTSFQGLTGDVTLQNGAGIVASGTTITNSGVLSLQGQNGNVALIAGSGIAINGTTISVTGSGGAVTSVDTLSGDILIANSSGSGNTITIDDASTSAKGIASFDGTNFTVTNGAVTLGNSGIVYINTLQQTTSGQNLLINAGSDLLTFATGGRTFILPTSGPASQTICTTGISCVAGGGQAVLLAPGSAQTNAGADASIFINNTSTGNLIELQGGGSDVFTVDPFGNAVLTNRTGGGTPDAFHILNDTGGSVLSVDTTPTTNQISNFDFESGTSGWVTIGATNCPQYCLSQDNTQFYTGSKSMKVVTDTGANEGARFAVTLTGSKAYSFSAWIKSDSGGISDLKLGFRNLANNDVTCLASKTVSAALWTLMTCNFNTNGGGTSVFIEKTGTTAETFYVDAARLLDDSGNNLTVGENGTTTGQIMFTNVLGGSITIQPADTKGVSNNILTLPNESGTICTDNPNSNCGIANDGTFLSKIKVDTASVAVADSSFLYTFKNNSCATSCTTGGVLNIDNNLNTGVALRIVDSGSGGDFVKFQGTGGTEKFSIDTNGVVHINDSSPTDNGTYNTGTIVFGRTVNGVIAVDTSDVGVNATNLTVRAANGGSGGDGGVLNLNGGAGGNGSSGGDVVIQGGDHGSTGGSVGGNIYLSPGSSSSAGGGRVIVKENGSTSTSDKTDTFQVQNHNSASIFTVDTVNTRVSVGSNTDAGTLRIADGNGFYGNLQVTTLGSGQVYIFPATGGNVCIFNSSGCNATTASKGIASFNSTNFSVSSGAVNTIQNINQGASPTFASPTFTGTLSVQGATITVGTAGPAGTNGSIKLQNATNAFGVTLNAPNQTTGSATVSLPDTIGSNSTFCLAAPIFNCVGTGGGVSGSGTTGTLPVFTTSSAIGDSTLSQSGGNLTATGSITVQGGSTTIGTSSQLGSLVLYDGSGNTATIQPAAHAANHVYTIPDAAGDDVFCFVTAANCVGGASGGAPNNAAYITVGNNSTLTNERALTAGTNIVVTDNGPNSSIVVKTVDNPVFATSVTTPILTNSGSTLQIISNNFNLATTGVVTLQGGQTADITTAAAATPTAITIKPGDSSSGTGAALTIKSGAGSGSNSGGVLTLQGGSGGSTGGGGAINIFGGTAGASGSGVGGGVGIVGGQGRDSGGGPVAITGGSVAINATGTAGLVSITGGTSNDSAGGGGLTGGGILLQGGSVNSLVGGIGGGVTLTASDGTLAGAGGALTFASGSSGGTGNNRGGNIAITTGNGSGLSRAGDFSVTTGVGGTTGAGGQIILQGGTGGTSSGAGGLISITSGSGNGSATSGAGGALTVQTGTGIGASAGGLLTIQGGQGGATGAGGGLTFASGAGGATSGAGGAISITSGAGTNGNSAGGAITLTTGAGHGNQNGGTATILGGAGGATNAGGGITLQGGAGGATSGNGGTISLTGGNASGSTGAGGQVNLNGGNSKGGVVGGSIGITAGAGGATADGGQVILTGGGGGTTSGNGGVVSLQGGAPQTSGNGGAVNITAGTALASNNVGGAIAILAGNSVGSGQGGAASLQGGDGGATGVGGVVTIQGGAGGATSGAGGGVQIFAGSATSGPGNGGNIDITAGTGAGAAAGGTITLTGGTISSFSGGKITISGGNNGAGFLTLQGGNSTGAGLPNGGNVLIQGGTNDAGLGTPGRVIVRPQASNDAVSIFVVENTNQANLINVDSSTTANLILNPDFENTTTGWALKGSATIARDTSNRVQGNSSLAITTTAAANDGAKYTGFQLAGSTTYTFHFFAKLSTGSMTTFKAGRSDNGSTDTDCLTAQTVTTTWTRFECTFTTGTVSGTRYVYVKQSDAVARTIYIDAVQLEQSSSATSFSPGGALQLLGLIDSPVRIKPLEDSSRVFNIQNSAGANIFNVDTTSSIVTLGQSANSNAVQVGSNNSGSLLVTPSANASAGVSITGTRGKLVVGDGTLDTGVALTVELGSSTADALDIQNSSNVNFLTVSNTGAVLSKNTSNSASAFVIQNSTGTPLFTADTSAMTVTVAALTVTGDITVNGHIVSGGTAPTASAGAAACTSPGSPSVSGTDVAGTVTIQVGTSCSGVTLPGTVVTVNFHTTYGSAPRVVLTPANTASAAIQYFNGTTGATSFTIDTNTAPTDSGTYIYNYLVIK